MSENEWTYRPGPWSVIPCWPGTSRTGPGSSWGRGMSPCSVLCTPSPTWPSQRRLLILNQISLCSDLTLKLQFSFIINSYRVASLLITRRVTSKRHCHSELIQLPRLFEFNQIYLKLKSYEVRVKQRKFN